jgi:hypothetical protein
MATDLGSAAHSPRANREEDLLCRKVWLVGTDGEHQKQKLAEQTVER